MRIRDGGKPVLQGADTPMLNPTSSSVRPDADDWVLAKRGEVCATYLPEGGTAELDLTNASGSVEDKW